MTNFLIHLPFHQPAVGRLFYHGLTSDIWPVGQFRLSNSDSGQNVFEMTMQILFGSEHFRHNHASYNV